MRKFFLGFLILLTLSFLTSGSVKISAQDTTQTSTVAAKVEYVLAYPGILPDNPLYFLKAARDKLVSFLISDLTKKAEFNLLTSDKRINAAFALSTRGKEALAVSTLSKSNNYLEQVVSSVASAKNSGRDVDIVLHNLKNAIKKHKDVTVAIKSKIDKKLSPQLQKEIQRLENFGRAVDQLLPQK